MSGLYTKVNGKFVLAQSNVKYSNQWRDTYQIYKKTDNTWKETYKYEYITGDWSDCSKPCGGGTQTRTLSCKRSDGIIKDNNYCRKYGVVSPSTIQQCNTHSCVYYLYAKLYYDDQYNFYILRRNNNTLEQLFSSKVNAGTTNISFQFTYDEFPLRLIFAGHNRDNGGGPRFSPAFSINNSSNKTQLWNINNTTSAHRDYCAILCFEMTVNNQLIKRNMQTGCTSDPDIFTSQGWVRSDYDYWTNSLYLKSL